VYFDKGFFPALAWDEKETAPEVTRERRQAISVTLENFYDDWCVAQLAEALGKQGDPTYFTNLAHNYQNLWNSKSASWRRRPQMASGLRTSIHGSVAGKGGAA
jgi:hypothetical protein